MTAPTSAGEPARRGVATSGLRMAGYAAILTAMAFSQSAGKMVADTKFDLLTGPGKFLASGLRLWDPTAAFGQIQNQAYGYAWPMGPFFLLGDVLHLPPWAIQRSWWALLLCLAFFGVVRLAQRLGLGTPFPVTALHGLGTGDLLDALVEALPEPAEPDAEAESTAKDEDRIFSVALVGRPNVGKSTLFNRLIGEDRSVVHDMPGTTRDAVDTVVETPDGPIRFVDTAGMRRKARIEEGTEYYSFVRALKAVDSSDVALLVIDGTEGVTHQDQRLAERIDAAGCPIVVLLNKWELLDTDARAAVTYEVGQKLAFLGESEVIRISALTGKNVHRLMPALAEAITAYHRRVPTRRVNEVVSAAQSAQPAPHGARILYATQGAADPPTFTLFANKELPATYLRYIERKLREAFDLGATPIKLRVRQRSN